MDWVLVALLIWVVFNWLAPFSVLIKAHPMSLGRFPSNLAAIAKQQKVRVYTAKLGESGGFSVLAWPWTLILVDSTFLAEAKPMFVRYLLAHELGHCTLGHLKWRWLATVTGVIMLPGMKKKLVEFEGAADAFAAQLLRNA